MSNDIQFGDLETAGPKRAARPDQNLHFAVVPYGAPLDEDLPIYVDVDVLREMELHAESDANVELGGVLLGGQFEDDQGRPFVVVTDSLRAEHYENTRGSFKFTHETWREITRQRDEFPDDLGMVGWYHTHPDWGVFLSGMDTFICDHFFNKTLDVALVIDPCRGDRAFFQWPTPRGDGPRRTSGFHVIGSRFRKFELDRIVMQLESGIPMSTDPRSRPPMAGYPAPVIQMPEARAPWISAAVIGMLLIQFCLVALLTWNVLRPSARPTEPTATARQELADQQQMLDQIIGKLDVAPEGVVAAMNKQRLDNEALQAANLGLLAHIRTLQHANETAKRQQAALEKKLDRLQLAMNQLKEKNTAQQDDIKALQKTVRDKNKEESAPTTLRARLWSWRWYWGSTLVVLLGLAMAAVFYWTATETESEETETEEE